MFPLMRYATFLLLCCLGIRSGLLAASDDWPQWRGPFRDGSVQGSAWPSNFAGLKPSWSQTLGPGYSGPIVSGSRVFVTETQEKRDEIVRALDRRTGKELWRQSWEGALSVPFFAKSNGDWIRATPACDGTNLFVAGMRDVLVCLDAATGSNRWRVDFVKQLKSPLPDFGFVSSPLADADAVYVQAGASVVKLNKHTGAILWRALQDAGGMWGSAFSSPLIATLVGRRQLVVQTREKLAGLALENGEVLWSQPVEAFRGMNILTPVVWEDAVLTSTYGGKTLLHRLSLPAGSPRARVEEAWVHKAQGYMSTPVIWEGHAYIHLKSQRFMCLELKTGEERWTTSESFGKYWSLVRSGNQILALDQRGSLYLLLATPARFVALDKVSLTDQEAWAHLASAGRELFVRDLHSLRAFTW